MNENTSKVVEYVLVILIALGVSYAVYSQANTYETRFDLIEKSVKDIQTKISTLDVDNIINQINIKGLKTQIITPEVQQPTTPATTETPAAPTMPGAPAVAPAPTAAPVK